jgi:hypothetical protein
MSCQNISSKGRNDSRDPAEFRPQRLFAFELRRAPIRDGILNFLVQFGPSLGCKWNSMRTETLLSITDSDPTLHAVGFHQATKRR